MNYTFVDNPYRDENIVITTRGVMTDAKIAKLNNETKRPAIVAHWEAGIPQPVVSVASAPVDNKKDYKEILSSIGIEPVVFPPKANSSGAKKLRVIQMVNGKVSNVYSNSEKAEVVPEMPKVELPKVEVEKPEEVKVEAKENPLEPNIISSREEIHGRHERTGEIPVNDIKAAIEREEVPATNNIVQTLSRSERNNDVAKRVDAGNVVKAGDMDEYNKLLHGKEEVEEDISRQWQGARDQLFKEEEKNKKVSEQLIAATRELEALKEKKDQILKMQEKKTKEEIERINNSRGLLQEDTLEKTNNLTSIQSEIAKLKAQMLSLEEENYEDNRSFGSRAA